MMDLNIYFVFRIFLLLGLKLIPNFAFKKMGFQILLVCLTSKKWKIFLRPTLFTFASVWHISLKYWFTALLGLCLWMYYTLYQLLLFCELVLCWYYEPMLLSKFTYRFISIWYLMFRSKRIRWVSMSQPFYFIVENGKLRISPWKKPINNICTSYYLWLFPFCLHVCLITLSISWKTCEAIFITWVRLLWTLPIR